MSLAGFEIIRGGVHSRDAKFAFVVGDGGVTLIRVKTLVLRRPQEDADCETFEGLAVFVADLAGDDAFGGELEKGRRSVGSKLKGGNAARPWAEAIVTKVAGLNSFKGDGAGGEAFKLEFAFGVGERGTRRVGGELYQGMGDGLAGDGIDDGTLKGTRAGGGWHGGLRGGRMRGEKELSGKEGVGDKAAKHRGSEFLKTDPIQSTAT